ncbi:patatin-like phospholipase family protein [Kitasatospora sp. MMS16-BH015]|uniref:patatin-like phospholipase family protein n=1 Tax=Kitasatospora sp. MMS16-BH015 TaxID=2018025 RepID=UPI000CF1FC27|nr:patatin-like phospholipase family protein [Kitasatospora sp. MMS16-BH015]
MLARRTRLIGADDWPEGRRLLIPAVDASTGEPVVWDARSGVPFVHAVAASSAFPGVEPPVTVQGRPHFDGALRAGVNADLAAGARTLVVVAPLAHRHQLDTGQLAATGAESVITITPDEASARALAEDRPTPAAWALAYREGHRQATEATAAELRPHWPST